MKTFTATESLVIDAPASHVYSILADYEVGHPAILPPKYFKQLDVLEGGQGSGTKIYVRLEVFGVEAEYTMDVTEPIPGHVIVETDKNAGVTTTFTVDPMADGAQSRVTISSVNRTAAGVRGWIEARINPMITRKIYREELAILAEYARQTISATA